MRQHGESFDLLGLVPDNVEIAADLMDAQGARPAPATVLQRRQIGRRNAERRSHLLERDGLLAAQLANAKSERRDGRVLPFRPRTPAPHPRRYTFVGRTLPRPIGSASAA